MYTTKSFWVRTFERAVKSAANSALSVGALSGSGAVTLDWSTLEVAGTAAVLGAVISVLMSIASAPIGGDAGPSLVNPEPAG